MADNKSGSIIIAAGAVLIAWGLLGKGGGGPKKKPPGPVTKAPVLSAVGFPMMNAEVK